MNELFIRLLKNKKKGIDKIKLNHSPGIKKISSLSCKRIEIKYYDVKNKKITEYKRDSKNNESILKILSIAAGDLYKEIDLNSPKFKLEIKCKGPIKVLDFDKFKNINFEIWELLEVWKTLETDGQRKDFFRKYTKTILENYNEIRSSVDNKVLSMFQVETGAREDEEKETKKRKEKKYELTDLLNVQDIMIQIISLVEVKTVRSSLLRVNREFYEMVSFSFSHRRISTSEIQKFLSVEKQLVERIKLGEIEVDSVITRIAKYESMKKIRSLGTHNERVLRHLLLYAISYKYIDLFNIIMECPGFDPRFEYGIASDLIFLLMGGLWYIWYDAMSLDAIIANDLSVKLPDKTRDLGTLNPKLDKMKKTIDQKIKTIRPKKMSAIEIDNDTKVGFICKHLFGYLPNYVRFYDIDIAIDKYSYIKYLREKNMIEFMIGNLKQHATFNRIKEDIDREERTESKTHVMFINLLFQLLFFGYDKIASRVFEMKNKISGIGDISRLKKILNSKLFHIKLFTISFNEEEGLFNGYFMTRYLSALLSREEKEFFKKNRNYDWGINLTIPIKMLLDRGFYEFIYNALKYPDSELKKLRKTYSISYLEGFKILYNKDNFFEEVMDKYIIPNDYFKLYLLWIDLLFDEEEEEEEEGEEEEEMLYGNIKDKLIIHVEKIISSDASNIFEYYIKMKKEWDKDPELKIRPYIWEVPKNVRLIFINNIIFDYNGKLCRDRFISIRKSAAFKIQNLLLKNFLFPGIGKCV